MSLGRRIRWTQQQNEISRATLRSNFDTRRCLGHPETRPPRARADDCTKHSGRAHNSVLSRRTWGWSPSPKANLGKNHRLLLVAGPEARCTALLGMLPSLRTVHSAQPNPEPGLRSMEVGGRGDCLAMDKVGGMDSLPQTPRGNRYILTLIDCFTRFAVAVPLVDQSAEVVIASVIGHYITVYGTLRRILTDQGRNFESAVCKVLQFISHFES